MPWTQLTLLLVIAQTPPDAKPSHRIEVASIKPSKPGAVVQDARISFPPGRFEATNVTLSEILDALTRR